MSVGRTKRPRRWLGQLAEWGWQVQQLLHRLSWPVRWRVRKARGLGGDFERPEDSERSRALTELWDRKWPASEPLGYILRYPYEARWIRFHSLPDSKRWPETPEELEEIIRRQRTVIAALSAGVDVESLVVITEDYSTRDHAGGSSKRYLPGAWPWRIGIDDLEDPADHDDDYRWYFWVRTGLTPAELDTLLAAIADDRARAVIANPELDWLFCPYDGGVDVILPTAEARDVLREQYRDWLSSDGL